MPSKPPGGDGTPATLKAVQVALVELGDYLRGLFIYWEEDGVWLGYLQEYPDYWTQGETLDDLKEHLRDLYPDLTSGAVPSIRKVDELIVS